jgi:rare lipoprotein A
MIPEKWGRKTEQDGRVGCAPHAAARLRGAAPLLGALLLALMIAGCGHHAAHTQPSAPPPQPAPHPQPPGQPPVQQPPAQHPQQNPPAVTGEYTEEGIASWYGVPFNGHRTSNGEIFDMHQLTAAHRTLPFNSMIRVTNLNNGQQTTVRINDRGPFVAGRIIDLSNAAAKAVGMIGTGTANVRLEMVSGENPYSGFFTVQVGAFHVRANAEALQGRLSARYSPVTIQVYDSPTGVFYRVRAGRVASLSGGQTLAEQLRGEGFSPFVVRLDE